MNEDSDFSEFKRITIIGCGLIGGSVGLTLKKKKYAVEIVGIDHEQIIEKASSLGAIDWGTTEIRKGVEGADLVILATPVKEIIKLMTEIKPFVSANCLVTDTGSSKERILIEAQKIFCDKCDFIGGHPMAGLENGGIEFAQAGLFSNKPFISVEKKGNKLQARQKMTNFIKMINAIEIKLRAIEHDQIISLVSHVPQLVAIIFTNLFGQLIQKDFSEDCYKIGGKAFNEMTRVASSPFSMWGDIYETNNIWTVDSIEKIEEMLKKIKEKIIKNPEELKEDFLAAKYFKEKMS
ncbi:MAG: prephenate dehydrogenase/arogenate dehydrogenase family protein [Atribacterota bacterium]|nr:prephenate dehydrogenase/arogenate dehydrogenase family protein [Atribacterota bacterium]